jgi:hypothetical protein
VSVLDGAVRVGPHVMLEKSSREPHTRVATIGTDRSVERWAVHLVAPVNPLDFVSAAPAGLPKFVDLVRRSGGSTRSAFLRQMMQGGLRAEHADALIFDAKDGVSLFEIGVRTELQRAVVEPAIVATILARAMRLASTPRAATENELFAPSVDAQTISVAWDGSIWFFGHQTWDRATWAGTHLGAPNTIRRGSAVIERFLREAKRTSSLLGWMSVIATSRTDESLARDPSPWSIVAAALDEVVAELGAVDDNTLAGFVQRLFPDDYARSLETREQVAMLTDDDLRAVPEQAPSS